MTSTKKKLIISLTSLLVVLMIAAVTFTAVWAARNARTDSGFTITYTAIQVKGTVSGTYQTNTMNSPTALSPATITFEGTEATNGVANVKNFTSVTPTLSESNNQAWVEFVYTIKNADDAANNMTIALNADPDTAGDNLTYTYTVSVTSGDATSTGSAYNNLVTELKPGKTATITIRATVDNLDTNVNASGTFAFVLTGVAIA